MNFSDVRLRGLFALRFQWPAVRADDDPMPQPR